MVHCGAFEILGREHAWRCALSLNNAAVSLFARGCFEQGKGLLRQAVHIIRHCSTATSSGDSRPLTACPNEVEFVNHALQSAAQDISKLSTWAHSLPLMDDIVILENNKSPSVILPQTSKKSMFTFVRIEASFNFDFKQAHMDLEVHGAYLLFNFGMLHLCQDYHYKQQQLSSFERDRSVQGLQLLKASQALLARNSPWKTEVPDFTAYVNLLALHHIVLLLKDTPSQESDAVAACKVLQEFQEYLLGGNGTFDSLSQQKHAAGAA